MSLQEWGGAELAFRQALKIDQAVGSYHSNLGISLQNLGRIQDAQREFEAALKLDPNHAEAMYCLGRIFAQDSRYADSAALARRILRGKADSLKGHLLIAIALVGLNDPHSAYEQASRALQLAPNHAEARTLAGEILQALGKMDEAQEMLLPSVQIEPRQGYAY